MGPMETPSNVKVPRKKRTVKEKVKEVIKTLEGQMDAASPAEKTELSEALDELEDVLGAPELTEDQKKHIIGYKEDGTPVFHPGF